MKPLVLCATLVLLTGCNSQSKVQVPEIGPHPAGLVKLLESDTGGTYADMRSVSSYQGNTHLRRFFLINNYIGPSRIKDNPPVYIASSTVINVVNCDTRQRAQFERIYFSQYWGRGNVVAKRDSIGQWETFPEESLLGIIASNVCDIGAARLKPELPRDRSLPLLSDLN